MASASRALRLSKLSPLPAAASRFLRPLAAAGSLLPAARGPSPAAAPWAAARGFATQPATSSLRDSSPNWTNRPPKETILLDGCDFEHWLVVMDPPPGDPGNPDVPREEIIDTYIKTLAQIVGRYNTCTAVSIPFRADAICLPSASFYDANVLIWLPWRGFGAGYDEGLVRW
ncbi:hypothetical protein ACQ4PT_051575 [Festuca glaucescens]